MSTADYRARMLRVDYQRYADYLRQQDLEPMSFEDWLAVAPKDRPGYPDVLRTTSGYLSVRTNSHGERVWSAVRRNDRLCPDTENLAHVLDIARQHFGEGTIIEIWDADKAAFTHQTVL